MDGHHVGLLQQILVVLVVRRPQSLDLLPAHKGVVARHLHAAASANLRYFPADGAHTDDSHGFALQLEGLLGAADLPVSGAHLVLGLHQVLGQGEHHGHGVLRHAAVVGSRGNHHRDPQFSGLFHIHGVIAHSGASDDLQIGAVFDGVAVTLGDAHNESICVLHLLQIIVGVLVIRHIDIGHSIQKLHALGTDGLGHHKFHLASFPSVTNLISCSPPDGCHNPWR